LAVAVLVSAPQLGFAQEKKDATAELLARLRKPLDLNSANPKLPKGAEIPGNELPLQEFADYLTERQGVPVVLNTAAFLSGAGDDPMELKVTMSKVKSLPLGVSLRQALAVLNATYLVRKGHIEIVPISFAAKEAKLSEYEGDEPDRLSQPLVSAIYKEKPANEALADLAEEYDLTIVVAPQAGDNKAGFVNARLLNVPADKAVELLAIQADLRVVKTGNAYLVTSKDHANELFDERFEKEQRALELARARYAPFLPKAPDPQPAPPAPPPAK
jgi:hypothetical protein